MLCGWQSMTAETQWITVDQAAKLTRYHPERIRELIRDGKVAARKFSIVWQVDRSSLLEYVSRMQRAGRKRGRKPAE